MPRSGASTRTRLLEAGLELFATRGLYTTPLKAVVDAAGQRNASALHYHFGSRDGLVWAIVEHYNSTIEVQRAQLLERDGAHDLRFLVGAWLVPQHSLLEDQEGRWFLNLVSQMHDLYQSWGGEYTPPQALRVMHAISDELTHVDDAAVRRERLTRFLDFTAQALGARSRRLDRPGSPQLDDATWLANVMEMSIGLLSASAPSPGPPSPPAPAGSR